MCKVYGYARISTAKQSIDRQIRNILAVDSNATVIQEVYTGTKYQGREELKKLLSKVKKGDTIIFDSVSRMSRNKEEGKRLYFELYEKGINLIFIKERHIDTDAYKQALESTGIKVATDDTAEGTLVNELLEAINKFMRAKAGADIEKAFERAEMEVTDLRQRTREGIETARLSGKAVGGATNRGKNLTTKKSKKAKEIIKKHSKSFGGSLGNADLMTLAGITEPTLLKYKKEIRQEMIENGEMEV